MKTKRIRREGIPMTEATERGPRRVARLTAALAEADPIGLIGDGAPDDEAEDEALDDRLPARPDRDTVQKAVGAVTDREPGALQIGDFSSFQR